MKYLIVVEKKIIQGEIKKYEVILSNEGENILYKNLQFRVRDQILVGFVQVI